MCVCLMVLLLRKNYHHDTLDVYCFLFDGICHTVLMFVLVEFRMGIGLSLNFIRAFLAFLAKRLLSLKLALVYIFQTISLFSQVMRSLLYRLKVFFDVSLKCKRERSKVQILFQCRQLDVIIYSPLACVYQFCFNMEISDGR